MLFLMVSNLFANHLYSVTDKRGTPSTWQYTGVVMPLSMVEIIAPSKAVLTSQHVNLGDEVKKNQVLFEFSSNELLENMTSKKHALLEQRLKVEELNDWDDSIEVLEAKASVQRASQSMHHAKERFEQTTTLFDAGIVSKNEFLQDKRVFEEGKLFYHNARQRLNKVKRKGSPRYIELAKRKLINIEHQVLQLKEKLDALTVYAPFNGIILAPDMTEATIYSNSGERRVFKEDEIVALVAQMDTLHVRIKVDEIDVTHLKVGVPCEVSIHALNGISFNGYLHDIGKQRVVSEKNALANYMVDVRLENIPATVQSKIRLGMSATATLLLTRPQGIYIPKSAVFFEDSIAYVSVKKSDGFIKKAIEIGESVENEVLVKGGLMVGDHIALLG